MKARLFSKTGAMAGSSFVISNQALIGRDAQCDITLYLHTVSSQHARIFLDPHKNAFMLEDLGSSNGTFVDKTRVESPVPLRGLHVITFARDVDMIFQVMTEELADKLQKRASTQKSSGPEPIANAPGIGTEYQKGFEVPEVGLPDLDAGGSVKSDPGSKTTYGQSFDALPNFTAGDKPADDETVDRMPAYVSEEVTPVYTLIIDTVKETDRRVTLKAGMNTIGRAGQCDVVIPDEYMSGKHAAIRIDDNGPILIDLGSRNGTFLGDDKIEDEAPLESGAIIRMGPTTKMVFKF